MVDEQLPIDKKDLVSGPENSVVRGRNYSRPILVCCGGILDLTQADANGIEDFGFSGTLGSFAPPPPPK